MNKMRAVEEGNEQEEINPTLLLDSDTANAIYIVHMMVGIS